MSENRFAGGRAAAPEQPGPGIDVKIYLPKDTERDHGKLLGFASVNLGGIFAVNNIRIYNSDKGPFVAMPSMKGADGKYHDICCPTTKEMRDILNSAILRAYQREVAQERPSIRTAIRENAAKAAASRPAYTPHRQTDRGGRW